MLVSTINNMGKNHIYKNYETGSLTGTLNLYLFFSLALTSSFDIFMNITFSGFNIRIFYIIELIMFLVFFKKISSKIHFKLNFVSYPYLLVWFLFIIIFIPNTTFIWRSIGYGIWLVFSIGIILLLNNNLNKANIFYKSFYLYIYSFGLIALFGIIQFVAGLIGINLYTTQWWIEGSLPRINGFCYEPSYYGSYLIIGWAILFYLYIKNNKMFLDFKYVFLVITISIILSSSRMSIIVMIFCIIYYLILYCFRVNYKILSSFKVKKNEIYNLLLLSIFLLCTFLIILSNLEKINFLFAGLGLFGLSSHSSETRYQEFLETLEIFLRSPLIGYSLGGISSARAGLHNVIINSNLEAKNYEGLNIFIENLAASGVIGFMFFIIYLITIYVKSIKLQKKLKKMLNAHSTVIGSLTFGLSIELLILTMNQNILRPYLWVLLGMLSASITLGKKIVYGQ